MTVTINGSGTIGGISVGGLNDNIITKNEMATGGAWAPAGTVLQVVSATYSTQVASTSSSWTDTGLSATITPTSATSKILLIANINGIYHGNSLACFGAQLVRNSTSICIFEGTLGTTNTSQIASASGMNYMDSPATTSAITYKVQFNNPSASATTYVQIPNSSYIATSALTLMEIAA
jgi:hypothetical protein